MKICVAILSVIGLSGSFWVIKNFDYVKYEMLAPVGEWIRNLFIRKEENPGKAYKPFIVSEYYARIEKAALDILGDQKPADQTITLWLGLDGLRMNKDGSSEWISRKKPGPVNQGVFCQPMQSLAQAAYPTYSTDNMCQNTLDTIGRLQAQLSVCNVNTQIQAQLQCCQVRYPGYYPSYFYGGTYPTYLSQMQNCCCNMEGKL